MWNVGYGSCNVWWKRRNSRSFYDEGGWEIAGGMLNVCLEKVGVVLTGSGNSL